MDIIDKMAEYLINRNFVIALSGAGISTESGIPDFRSKGGLWDQIDPEILSARTLRNDPVLFFRHYQAILEFLKEKQPNRGHRAIARLSRLGIIKAVITQNIDGLHQKAGSKRVFEVHGSASACFCTACRRRYPADLLAGFLAQGDYLPRSPCCRAILRPAVVLFGDRMADDFAAACEEARRCDFLLVVGTSLTVYPAADIPGIVGDYAIVNRDPTALDATARFVVRDGAGDVLSRLADAVEKLLPSRK